MAHLSAEELIDCLDGGTATSAHRHLTGCPACRARLDELRTTMASVAQVDVPEPSSEFWRQFSDRVLLAVEPPDRPARRVAGWLTPGSTSWWGWTFGAGAAVAFVLAVLIGPIGHRPRPDSSDTIADTTDVVPTAASEVPGDPQMALVVDLASGLDWDDFGEAGLAPRVGSVDSALTELTDAERVELERLLSEAIRRAGA
jgi:anti-sigma factor RsiW